MDIILNKITKSLHGRLSSLEEKELIEWIAESEVNREFYQKIKRLHQAHNLQKIEKTDIQKEWETLERNYNRRRGFNKKFYIKTAVAAAIFIGIIFTGIAVFQNNKIDTHSPPPTFVVLSEGADIIKEINSENTIVFDTDKKVVATKTDDILSYHSSKEASAKYHTLTVPYGSDFTVILSDSTVVHLNAGSSLKYPVSFTSKEKRRVTLTGEAFFDVQKDASTPFIVKTNNVDVTVLGTEFNVTAYSNDFRTDIALVEGAVKIESATSSFQTHVLEPNQVATLNNVTNNLSISKKNLAPFLSWRTGGLILHEETFDAIIRKLERKYNVSITNTYTALNNKTFTATLTNETIEEVIHAFNLSYSFDYVINRNTKTIVINKPKKT